MTNSTPKSEKPLYEILGDIKPELRVISDPNLLVVNPLNPRDGSKGTDDLISSFRAHGYKPYQDAEHGHTYHIVAFRHPEEPEKYMLLRGHRRAGALRKLLKQDQDADKVAKLADGEKTWPQIIKEAQMEFDLNEPGIPVMVYEEPLTEAQQLALILDEDTSQVRKDARGQYKLFIAMRKNGIKPEQACRHLGFARRYMPFVWASKGVMPEEVVQAWLDGGPGADKKDRMTDSEFKKLYETFRDENDLKVDPGSGAAAFTEWKNKGDDGDTTAPKPATPVQMQNLMKKLALRDSESDLVKVAKLVASYAAGQKLEGRAWTKIDADQVMIQILDALPAAQLQGSEESSDEVATAAS